MTTIPTISHTAIRAILDSPVIIPDFSMCIPGRPARSPATALFHVSVVSIAPVPNGADGSGSAGSSSRRSWSASVLAFPRLRSRRVPSLVLVSGGAVW